MKQGKLGVTSTSIVNFYLHLTGPFLTFAFSLKSLITSLSVHTREKQYLSLIYNMYASASNKTPSYTQVSWYEESPPGHFINYECESHFIPPSDISQCKIIVAYCTSNHTIAIEVGQWQIIQSLERTNYATFVLTMWLKSDTLLLECPIYKINK